ncbi:MAG: hypothetical protein IKM20_01880 [Erysipelotrichales bacterium]|nr:hypothetical protein [Erysipelotrichales bacterium]
MESKKKKIGLFGVLLGFAALFELVYVFLMLFKGISSPVTKVKEVMNKENS